MGDWLDEMVDDEDIEDELDEEDFGDCMCSLCQGNCPDLEDEDE